MALENIDIQNAYLYLKSYAYHENLNLFLKQRVAKFETEQNLDETFTKIKKVLTNENLEDYDRFNEWLDQISLHIIPKNIDITDNGEKSTFISNITEFENYNVQKVNYLINAPIELHIIEILWCMYVGPALEKKISKDTYGNRLNISFIHNTSKKFNKIGNEIFKKYIDQYNKWREGAIDIANKISKDGDNVLLLSLDLKSYYYNIDINYEEITIETEKFYEKNTNEYLLSKRLINILKKINNTYNNKLKPYIEVTHPENLENNKIPIGFASSGIISNWYLLKFDTLISKKVRPSYYGRYVDDMIFVFKNPDFNEINPVESLFENYFKDLINIDNGLYNLHIKNHTIPLQKEKLLMQYYDKDHSIAGLEVFRKNLDERSSAFDFLSNECIHEELNRYSYQLLHKNSKNNIYNFIGLGLNEFGLSKYLSSHITAHRLSKFDQNNTITPQLETFFKGYSALDLYRMWEKIYQYSVVTQNYNFVLYFYNYLKNQIQKINHTNENIMNKLTNDLLYFNNLAISINFALLDILEYKNHFDSQMTKKKFKVTKNKIENLINSDNTLHEYSWQFRKSNLIRHHLVGWPLANYSNYSGDLTCEKTFNNDEIFKIDDQKLKFSPRFIHYDEWQIFKLSQHFLSPKINLVQWFNESKSSYEKDLFNNEKLPINLTKNTLNSNIIKSELHIIENKKQSNIKLAIGNFVVDENDISSALRKDQSPNIEIKRQEKLFNILKSSLSEKSDILIMPEVSVPISWLPFLISFSRKYQIGLVFGLEHWVSKNRAYNLIIEALPFKISDTYNSCALMARIKNHYAPAELKLLNDLRIEPGNIQIQPQVYYHKVSWRGVTFTTYNCFELSDISHRVLFKSEIDLLFACVWNKDTNYYHHILESAVRDLHCYTVQANTSQYGGSCVLRPTKTESKTMLYVKGGENPCVLTTSLNISALREFQFKSSPNHNDTYKHLPPGYNNDLVLKR